MEKFPSILMLLVLAVTVAKAANGNNPCTNLRNGPFVCADCETLGYCIQENGEWSMIELAKCDTKLSMFCNEDDRSCTFQKACDLQSTYGAIKFECQYPGQYPDPYDCRSYHLCSNFNEDKQMKCPSGFVYSASAKNCIAGSSANTAACNQAQFHCERQGQIGAWPDDANIYYICWSKNVDGSTVYYPLMYRCQSGYIFNGSQCVLGNGSGVPDGGATCTGNEVKAHPTICRSYYHCKSGQFVVENCPDNTFFDTVNLSCKFGNC